LCIYCIFTIDWTLRISYVHTGQYYYNYYYYYYDYSHYDYDYDDDYDVDDYYYYYCLAYDINVFMLYVVFV